MQTVIINLKISPEEYLKQYQFVGAVVSTHSIDGRSVTFPANILKQFVTHDGINGRFQISFDNQGKFQSINQLPH